MQVSSASASAFAGLVRAQRSLDVAASSVSATFTRAASVTARSAGSDPLDGVSTDAVAPFVQMIAAQRAFTASLVVMRTDAEMQRTIVERRG